MKHSILIATVIATALMVLLPRAVDASGYPAPYRISFAPGATSATVYGALSTNCSDQWVLRIFGGQTLSVNLAPIYGVARFSVIGANGVQLINGTTFWSGAVPETQDYTVTVYAYNNTSPRYTLTVTAPPVPGPNPAPTRRDVSGTWNSNEYIVELEPAIGCMNAQCPVVGRLIHITSGAPEIVDIQGNANSISGNVFFHTEIPGGQSFNGSVSADSRSLSGTLSGHGWISFTR